MVYEQMQSRFPNAVPEYDQTLFGRHLNAIGEEPLYAKRATNASIYQLLWLRMRDRPGDSPSIFVRLEQTSPDEPVHFLVKRTQESYSQKEDGKLILNEERILPVEHLRAFEDKLTEIDFWSIPTFEKGPIGGELWLFEVLRDGRYHAVDRCCLEVAVGTVLDETVSAKLPASAAPVIEKFRPLAELAVLILKESGIIESKKADV